MKRLRSIWSSALIVAVLATAFLFSTTGNLRTAEAEVNAGSGETLGIEDFLCDPTQMPTLLNQDEEVRVCIVDAVTKSEPARKLVMKKMLGTPAIREMIMDAIASTPALKKMMEAKLAAAPR